MCNKIVESTAENAKGYFSKRPGVNPIEMTEAMPIIVAPCECGRLWWARTPHGVVWVEAVPEAEREPSVAAVDEFKSAIE